MNEQSRILLVEDNPLTSKTILVFLSAVGYDVVCAYDGRQAIDKFQVGVFDLVMLDLMLPDTDGLKVCESIRSASDVPVIMLTAKTTEDEIVLGLESGADDYVCKPFGSKELLARVRRCLRQSIRTKPTSSIYEIGELQIEAERRRVTRSGNEVKLTKSEYEILFVLLSQPGRVFTRSQLIDRVFGASFDGYDRTIDTHIWSLRKKLGEPRGNPKYILSELGVGYRMSDQHAQ